MALVVSFFNHKGGVSKTTTAFHLGYQLASMDKRVLLVDADPQCNLSALVLGDEFESYYENEATCHHNIKEGVSPVFEARPVPLEAIDCHQHRHNQNLYLLAGHVDLSTLEASLSLAQNTSNVFTALQSLPGAFHGLIESTCQRYHIDYVFIDMNPSLSAINQNLFMSSDAFILPTNPDLFSRLSIKTLSKILPQWMNWANRIRPSFATAAYPMPEKQPKFIGAIVQRFNIRNGKPSAANTGLIHEIQRIVNEQLVPALSEVGMTFDDSFYTSNDRTSEYILAEIPDFQSLSPKAIKAGKPVFDLQRSEMEETGVVLENMEKSRDSFKTIFEDMARVLLKLETDARDHSTI